jgi:ribosomal protein S18 acetylase RimI-like enzyme
MAPGSQAPADPQPLLASDLPRLRLEQHPRLNPDEAVGLLEERPGASFWIPATAEFVLVTPWRHRSELVTVHTFGAFANEEVLLRAAMTEARARGAAGFVVVDINETRHPSFYTLHGLRQIEEIVTYEHRRLSRLASEAPAPTIDFRRVDGTDPALLDEVLAVDHAAFPWFWWNSSDEFQAYLGYPGVEVWAGVQGGEVVAYTGSTHYLQWGHLDRIATRPDLQGSGIGRATLSFTARRIVARGSRRLALSTQGNNQRSRTLYQRSGFVRTPNDDYSVFVASFDDGLVYAGMTR